MARRRLSHPDQPFWQRTLLRTYEFLASLKLAVLLILGMAGVLAFATFVESNFGSAGVQYYIYYSWWFVAGQVLLAVNIFCAAAIRYPWKRHQTGFVITHLGLLTLLAGSAVSYRGSVDTQMIVFEGDTSRVAVDPDDTLLTLENVPGREGPVQVEFQGGPFNWRDRPFRDAAYKLLSRNGITRGWMNVLGMKPSDVGELPEPKLLYQNNEVRIEAVDYLAQAEQQLSSFAADPVAPGVSLNFYNPMIETSLDVSFGLITYRVGDAEATYAEDYMRSTRDPRTGRPITMGRVVLWKTDSQAELDGFLWATPKRDVPKDGTLVVWWGEEDRTHISIEELQRATDENPIELPDGSTVKLVSSSARYTRALTPEFVSEYPWTAFSVRADRAETLFNFGPAAVIEVTRDGKTTRQTLMARYPFTTGNVADSLRVEFYHPDEEGRVDLLLGPENQLLYRVWQQKQKIVVSEGAIPLVKDSRTGRVRSREIIDTFSTGGVSKEGVRGIWEMTVDDFRTEVDAPIITKKTKELFFPGKDGQPTVLTAERVVKSVPVPKPFDKDDDGQMKRLLVRVSQKGSDGKWSEVDQAWVPLQLTKDRNGVDMLHVAEVPIPGEKKPLKVSMALKSIDVGFLVKLVDFEVKQDPGTTMAADYESFVALIDVRDDPDVRAANEAVDDAADEKARYQAQLKLDTLINQKTQQKLDAVDKLSWGQLQTVREKDDAIDVAHIFMNHTLDYPDFKGRNLRFFQEQFRPAIKEPPFERPAASIFRVNRDPGRWVKYLGSALISVGIFMMFYMRAYFFKKPATASAMSSALPPPRAKPETEAGDDVNAENYALLSDADATSTEQQDSPVAGK